MIPHGRLRPLYQPPGSGVGEWQREVPSGTGEEGLVVKPTTTRRATDGTDPGPGDHLLTLLRHFRLSRREQVVIVVLRSPAPLTSREVARRTQMAYSHAKAVSRELVGWGILERTPNGLRFQTDPERWGPRKVPSSR
jgi:hypothetical protein